LLPKQKLLLLRGPERIVDSIFGRWGKDLNLEGRHGQDDLSIVSSDDFSNSNTLMDFHKQLTVFVKVNVCRPLVSDSIKHLGKEVKGELSVANAVHEPLLLNLRGHLLLPVDREEHLID